MLMAEGKAYMARSRSSKKIGLGSCALNASRTFDKCQMLPKITVKLKQSNKV